MIVENSAESSRENTRYLMAFFREAEGSLFYAMSDDGLHWQELNDGKPVFNVHDGSVQLRDPYIIRIGDPPDGLKRYHMVHTAGWDNPYIFHWQSDDLIEWVAADGSTNSESAKARLLGGTGAVNAWAPKFHYDRSSQEFSLFWTSRGFRGIQRQRILSSSTTDWRTFSDVDVLFDPGYSVIDFCAISCEDDGWMAVYKLEETASIDLNDHEKKRFAMARGPSLSDLSGDRDFLPEVRGVEGPCLVETPDGYRLYFDQFASGQGWGVAIREPGGRWQAVPSDGTRFPEGARHGSVLLMAGHDLRQVIEALPLGR